MNHAIELQKERDAVPADIEAAGDSGERARATAGRALYDLNVRQYCCAGLNFGYFYDGSPLIAYDGGVQPDYTLLRLDPSLDVTPLVDAAAARGVPLVVLDVASAEAAAVYDRRLVLSRPDQHVAWRGNAVPADAEALVDLIRGAAPARWATQAEAIHRETPVELA